MRRRTAEDRNKNKKKNNKPSSRTKPEPKKLVQARIVRVEPSNAPAVSIANDDYYFSDDDDTDDGCSSDEVVAVVAAQPMVEVIAPATLPAQYVFPAMVGNQVFLARVPPGGIQQGQRFSVPLPMKQQGRTKQEQQYVPPIGYWKDGFSDFFRFGVFHPTVWNSCCCTMIATGQIISRLQLTWKGHTTNSNTPQATTSAFYRLYALACVYWIFRVLNFAIVAFLDSSADEEPSNWYYFVCALDDILWYGYFAFCIYVLKNIRSHLRAKYSIPEGDIRCVPDGYEDCCCSLVCPCLTAAQMLHHTADYDTHPAQWCSETGLSPTVPAIV